MSDTVKAGTECDSSSIEPCPRASHDWRCKPCGATFDLPEVRERKSVPGGGNSLGSLSKAGWKALAIGREKDGDK